MEINFIYLIFLCYFIGSIPFAFIITKIFKQGDIRKIGSGNVGATNVLRTGKKSLALLVLTLDIIKGFFPIVIISIIYENYSLLILILVGSFSIIGHIFPIWLKFKGGKGVATYIGFILAINYKLGIIFILIWLLIAFLKKYSSLASIASLVITPIAYLIIFNDLKVFFIMTILSFIIIYKHYSNIKRLISGLESKIKL